MINDEANNFYYFAVKNFSEFFRVVKTKKRSNNNNNDNDFEDALDDALNYQTIEKKTRNNIKIKGLY